MFDLQKPSYKQLLAVDERAILRACYRRVAKIPGRRGAVLHHALAENHQAAGTDLPASSLVASDSGRADRTRDYGSLDKSQYDLFVQFFRQASPYIEGHRGRTFVIVVPGEIVDRKDILHCLLEDVALLHGLGVKLVLVVGARMQINQAILAQGSEPKYAGGLRVTDAVAMQAAIQAAGAAQMEVEARLSKGPAVTVIRRHTRSSDGSQMRFGPAVTTVSGNYVAAKRKGVVDGVDYQYTGVVRFVQTQALKQQLKANNVVLLSNLGYSAAGEVLNCDTYTVATRAALDLGADKLILVTLPQLQPLALPAWLPLRDAEEMLRNLANEALSAGDEGGSSSATSILPDPAPLLASSGAEATSSSSSSSSNGGGVVPGELDFDRWYELGLPIPLLAACTACKGGVKRAHLINAEVDGALLLELYSRDGVGAMISTDFYEGMRQAGPQDLSAIQELLAPLEDRGILVKRSPEQLAQELPHFRILERESKVLACATLMPLGENSGGETVAEVAAFCVHPDYRGGGKGDSLLEYLESDARLNGIDRLVLLTTRTADWFEQRGFSWAGPAHEADILPETRRLRINPARNSQLYAKDLRA